VRNVSAGRPRCTALRRPPGLEVEAWTYNGTIPGPIIRVEVGDRLIVHFTNNLPR
jgi:nitrite reductase (NO-forming)